MVAKGEDVGEMGKMGEVGDTGFHLWNE